MRCNFSSKEFKKPLHSTGSISFFGFYQEEFEDEK